jgi:hypothetical protein
MDAGADGEVPRDFDAAPAATDASDAAAELPVAASTWCQSETDAGEPREILLEAPAPGECDPGGVRVALSAAAACPATRQCSRSAPTPEGAFDIDPAELPALECALLQLDEGVRVADYVRQYVGIWVEGRRSIYINALRDDIPFPGARDTPHILCDGFDSAWGALYDIETQSLSQFGTNGGL